VSIFAWPLIALVRVYQVTLGHVMGGHCRFQPTCSHYAIEALKTHGAIKGSVLAIWRVLRCQPFARSGFDPVPPRK
jgi:putative membrane protein insertion efficiency factor